MKVETAKKDTANTEGASCSSQTVEDHAQLKRKLEWKCEGAREVRLVLQDSGLWRRFHEIGTEMIITKAGRRMFPSVRVRVDHLDPLQLYDIAMDIVPVDYKRYRYAYHTSQWLVAGHTRDWCVSPHLCVHPDSPSSGKTWMRHVITFDRVKLTNNLMDDKGHVVLKSMHRYRPRVHVIARACDSDERLSSLPKDGVLTFSFPETQFTTVTAYQNQQITQLKIDKNPFAKGFKEPANRGMLNQILEPWSSPFKPVTKRVPAETQVSGSWAATSDLWSSAEHHTMFFCPQHWYTSPHPIRCSQAELMVLSGIHDPLTVLMEHRGRPLQDTPDGRTSLFESHLFSCAFPLTHHLLQLHACRSSPAVHHLLPLIQHHSQFSSELQPNISLFFS